MNEATEKDRGTATGGRTDGPLCGNLSEGEGSVSGSCTSDLISFVVAEISNSPEVAYLRVLDAESRVCVFITLASVGTKAGETLWSVRAGVSGSSGEPAATSDRRGTISTCGAVWRCGAVAVDGVAGSVVEDGCDGGNHP